nr:MAG TPA: hypothetical protein [Bacteriophage sp.]
MLRLDMQTACIHSAFSLRLNLSPNNLRTLNVY